jgi:hypothetical protein
MASCQPNEKREGGRPSPAARGSRAGSVGWYGAGTARSRGTGRRSSATAGTAPSRWPPSRSRGSAANRPARSYRGSRAGCGPGRVVRRAALRGHDHDPVAVLEVGERAGALPAASGADVVEQQHRRSARDAAAAEAAAEAVGERVEPGQLVEERPHHRGEPNGRPSRRDPAAAGGRPDQLERAPRPGESRQAGRRALTGRARVPAGVRHARRQTPPAR